MCAKRHTLDVVVVDVSTTICCSTPGMDPVSGNVLFTALNALGLAAGVLSLGVSGAVYFFSRAGKIRSFEGAVYSQLTNANARIETLESSWLQKTTELTALADEMVTTAERTAKERRRLYAEHKREVVSVEGVTENGGDISTLPREEQLRRVTGFLRGGK